VPSSAQGLETESVQTDKEAVQNLKADLLLALTAGDMQSATYRVATTVDQQSVSAGTADRGIPAAQPCATAAEKEST